MNTFGEQPIGTSFIESTGNPDYPFVAHSPTMRVPGSIEGTDMVADRQRSIHYDGQRQVSR